MFNDIDIAAAKQAYDANAIRQRLVASNVANINTPGYKTLDVDFQKIFDAATGETGIPMRMTHERHMQPVPLDGADADAVFMAYNPDDPQDGKNDVDIDREMVKNAETAMNISIYAKILRDKYRGLKENIDAPV